jgi:hypothetical protein
MARKPIRKIPPFTAASCAHGAASTRWKSKGGMKRVMMATRKTFYRREQRERSGMA